MDPAVFLDRDGTILEDTGSLTGPDDVVFIPGAVGAMQLLQRKFRLFIVANQSGVHRGIVTLQQVRSVNGHMLQELHRDGICIEEMYACPGATQHCCRCHRPQAQFLKDAAQRYGLDLSQSWFVGDHPHDAELGQQAGGRGIYVLTGHGQKHRDEVPPGVAIAYDLCEATRIIFAGMPN